MGFDGTCAVETFDVFDPALDKKTGFTSCFPSLSQKGGPGPPTATYGSDTLWQFTIAIEDGHL